MPRWVGAVCVALACGSISASATAPIRLHVRPLVGVGMQRTVRIEVRIIPIATDRVLALEISSETFFRHSETPIEGADASPLQVVVWRDIPAGDYVLVAALGPWAGPRATAVQPLRYLATP